MNNYKAMLAVMLAATAFGAGAQTTGVTQGQPATGATYRPSLDGQETSTPAPTIDMRPMTETEKATGRQEPSRLKDIDPATHPQPQNVRPQPTVMPPARDSQAAPPSARAPLPAPTPTPATAPAPVGPTSTPVSACTGATCTDASGATTTGQVGNASVNSAGRLCNRTGNTMQCF